MILELGGHMTSTLLVLDTVYMIFAVVGDSWTRWSHNLCTLLVLDTAHDLSSGRWFLN